MTPISLVRIFGRKPMRWTWATPTKGWRNSLNGAAADPFLIRDELRDREHHRCWVEALIAAVTPQTAEKANGLLGTGAGPQILKARSRCGDREAQTRGPSYHHPGPPGKENG